MRKNKKIKLQPGDVICFELESGKYGFAKVLAKPKLGDAIEVYDYFSDNPNDYKNALQSSLIFSPIILDGYSIFWKKCEDTWNVIAHDEEFKFDKADEYKFKYGVPGMFKLIDLNDKTYENISQKEAEIYPDYSPYSANALKHRINFLLKKRGDSNEI